MTLATALKNTSLSIALIDAQPFEALLEAGYDGRTTAIAHGAADIYRNAGVWDEMHALSGPITDIRIADQHSPLHLHYSHIEVGDNPMGYICENRDMRRIMLQHLKKAKNITLLSPRRCHDTFIENNQRMVKLDDGTMLRANVVFAADSKFSAVRDMLGIEHSIYNYPQTAMVTVVRHEEPHQGVALERFMSSGPFASLPMKDPHLSAIVWTEENDRVEAYTQANDADFMRAFQKRFGQHLGTLELASKRASYPLTLIHAKHYTTERACVLGDAAHAIHPIAGQGFNLTLRDITELCSVIRSQQLLGLDVGDASVLKQFEALRRSDNWLMIGATHGLNGLFSNRSKTLRMVRQVGLTAVAKLPHLKQGFIRHAMGV